MAPQRDAIEKINKMFGLNIEIDVPKYMDDAEIEKEEKKEDVKDE